MFTIIFITALAIMAGILVHRAVKNPRQIGEKPKYTLTDSLNMTYGKDKASIPLTDMPESAGVVPIVPEYGIDPFLVRIEDMGMFEDSVIGAYVRTAAGELEPDVPGMSREDMLHGTTFLNAKRQAAQLDGRAREHLDKVMTKFCESLEDNRPIAMVTALQLTSIDTLTEPVVRREELSEIFHEIVNDTPRPMIDNHQWDKAVIQPFLSNRRADRKAARNTTRMLDRPS